MPDLNGLIKRASEFRDLRRAMANALVADMVGELIEALENTRKPMPDNCMTRKQAEEWDEGRMAYSIPIIRRTMLELFDRTGHGKDTAEKTQN